MPLFSLSLLKLFAILLAWMLVASVLTACLYAWDKRAARRDAPRIRERTLLLWSLAGGWPGGWLAASRLRHKTSKRSYRIRFAACVVVNLAAVAGLLLAARSWFHHS